MNPASSPSRWFTRFAEALDRVPALALALFPLVFFGLMVVGLVRWYTPVPFWDMWDAYLAAYIQSLLEDDWRIPFGQTNEHRIWFSAILFYIDLTFLEGRSLLLVPMNAILVLCIWLTLALIARRLLKDNLGLWPVVALGLGPLCFSWLQEQNLSWGFQSQFFVAYLFPLAAFACLAMSFDSPRSRGWYLAALLFGLASLGTMANGILVMPLLVAMLLVMPRPDWKRAAIIFVLGAVAITLWFQGYFFVERDRANLSQAMTFVLTFLGLPFEAIFDNEQGAYTAGVLFIVSCIGFTLWWFRRRAASDPMVLALLTFLAYIGASCAVIALGRAAIQPNAALVSRYSTPSLIAWAVLAILFAHVFRHVRFARAGAVGLTLLLGFGLLDAQREVFSAVGPATVHNKMAGALALKMRVADLQIIGAIYPTGTKEAVDHVRYVANEAEKKQLSIMGDPMLSAAVASLGTAPGQALRPCAGVIEASDIISGEDRFRRVSGWAFDEKTGHVPPFIYIVANGRVAGVAATGAPRSDVADAIDKRAGLAGFTGFLNVEASSAGLSISCDAR